MSRKSLLGRKRKKSQKEIPNQSLYFEEELEPVEVNMTPSDQLQLNEAELDEEITKTLTCLDPNQASKVTHFNFKSGEFVSKANSQSIAMHINKEGIIWSVAERRSMEKLALESMQKNDDSKADEIQKTEAEDSDTQTQTDTQKSDEKNDDSKEEIFVSKSTKKKEILVKNQFNFSDRASQTFNEPLRDREIQTEPAPKSVFSQNANPSAIRDEYLSNLLKVKQAQIEEENKKKKSSFGNQTQNEELSDREQKCENKMEHSDENEALLHSKAMLKALKIMERVTVLNANSESYSEFRYYKDSDHKKGSFLKHLWTFQYNAEESETRMITCLEWNAVHLDLFGVGYGSYDFNAQTNGMICVYSLKSTAFPEKIVRCESGVMCLSFHPKYSSLLCVGLYDGSVAVYDIRNRGDCPIYASQNPESHHSDPVWDIQWYSNPLKHDLMFYSISSDSEIKCWKLSQNELIHETLIKLKTANIIIEDDITEVAQDSEDSEMNALCACFDFNPEMEHLYLVGTEDGHIMQCHKTYNDAYVKLHKSAHFMNIYCLKWNRFHSKVFLSCSEDWTVKLWEIETETETEKAKQRKQEMTPIITYDLGSSVNDICWAPFSSTVFAAVTSDNKVHVFDLRQNKNAPLCTHTINKAKKGTVKLTKVSFPIGFPLVVVGDEKGMVFALKLSPNLYLSPAKHRHILKHVSPAMFSANSDFKAKEKQKLISVLSVTGKKVFDLVQHFSPQKIKSPKRM